MKVLVRKMDKLGLLKFVNIFYAVIMIALALVIPVTIIVIDVTLFTNPTVLGLIALGILFYGVIGYFTFIRPFIVYRKLPQVLAEADDEFLYIHGKKEGKIPLSSLAGTIVDVDVPHIFHPGFVREFIIHTFSHDYGHISLDIPEYGEFKMRFVADAEEVAEELLDFINQHIED